MKKYQMETVSNYAAILLQTVAALMDRTAARGELRGEHCDENTLEQHFKAAKDRFGLLLIYLFAAILRYTAGHRQGALDKIEAAKPYLDTATGGNYYLSLFHFYRGLIQAAAAAGKPAAKTKQEVKRIRQTEKKFRRWSRHGSMNFKHKLELLAAERFKLEGAFVNAEINYAQAIEGARKNSFIQEAAMACERLALFYHERQLSELARTYMLKAVQAYARWGAVVKADTLQNRYANLISGHFLDRPGGEAEETDSQTSSGMHLLDIQTVIKASQAISGEIILARLLENIMKIAIENAGAQRGILLNEQDGALWIEIATDHRGNIEFLGGVPLEAYPELPSSIIQYVFKTGENLVLDNGAEDERFARDPYIVKNQNKSILCIPIQQKNATTTLLYLENNLTTNAFTRDRLALLNVLSAQAAISIENARLFEIARRDGLTELINRRYFQYSLEKEIKKAKNSNSPLALLIMDIDHFKYFNDTYGHPVGDRVLIEVARILKENATDKDLAARYGGEEFTLLLPGMKTAEAEVLAEKIRRDVEKWHLPHEKTRLQVTISLGLSVFPEHGANSRTLIRSADSALYQSKENGRNRVAVYKQGTDAAEAEQFFTNNCCPKG